MVGSEVAGFRIVDALPTSSIAQLYLARREGDDRDYVVKMISQAAIGDRYERASRLLEPIEHPNLVPIVATAREGSRFLVVTPYYPDGDLERLVRRVGPLPLDHLVALLGQIAAALDALHAAGIVHRDVKPANILLDRDAAFLADPGLARLIRSDTSITTTGAPSKCLVHSPDSARSTLSATTSGCSRRKIWRFF